MENIKPPMGALLLKIQERRVSFLQNFPVLLLDWKCPRWSLETLSGVFMFLQQDLMSHTSSSLWDVSWFGALQFPSQDLLSCFHGNTSGESISEWSRSSPAVYVTPRWFSSRWSVFHFISSELRVSNATVSFWSFRFHIETFNISENLLEFVCQNSSCEEPRNIANFIQTLRGNNKFFVNKINGHLTTIWELSKTENSKSSHLIKSDKLSRQTKVNFIILVPNVQSIKTVVEHEVLFQSQEMSPESPSIFYTADLSAARTKFKMNISFYQNLCFNIWHF